MNSSHRRLILIGLIAALLAGGFTGWLWGDNMHAAKNAKQEHMEAGKAYRALLYSENTKTLTARIEKAANDLKAARADKSYHPDDIRELERKLRMEQRALTNAPAKLEKLRTEQTLAKERFKEHSASYSFYRITSFGGKLFLNLLNLLVIPLVVTSLITGISALGDIRHVGKTGLRTIIYYFITTSVAVIIGIVLVQIIAPGIGVEESASVASKVHGKEDLTILDTILRVFVDPANKAKGAFPSNIFAAMSQMNVLGVIVFSLFFGGALTMVGEKAKPVITLFEGANEAILKMIHLVFYLLPIGVFGLIVGRLAETGGGSALWTELTRLSLYAITVIGGLGIHAVIVLPLILWIFTKRNPLKFASMMAQALFTAFSTASSSATLPTTLECAEENAKISNKAASFVLPIGATINMDGTALYEAVAVIFIAQVYNIPMDVTMLVVVFLTATLAAIGAAGIPEAGLVTMVIVLNATGLPLEGIAILLSIDWFLDRCRTTVNVWGDSVGAAVIDTLDAKGA
ncbi:MAG: dicarboxylate/amino acid:cation symporter [Proteobacteria bacterium]|nr:dicarboxylate/amino acid:cation symporter [Pseudomonadota bacterium]